MRPYIWQEDDLLAYVALLMDGLRPFARPEYYIDLRQ